MTRAVVLVSGGIDSMTLLYLLLKENVDTYPVFVNYNQRNLRMEKRAIRAFEKILSLKIKEVKVEGLKPDTMLIKSGNKPSFYYPFRNLMLLTIAGVYADEVNANDVYIGLTQSYTCDVIFPDASMEFLSDVERLFEKQGHPIRLHAPFLNVEKGVVVYMGKNLGVPYSLTYSCYLGKSTHCGKCPACINRKLAFKRADVDDPTEYEN